MNRRCSEDTGAEAECHGAVCKTPRKYESTLTTCLCCDQERNRARRAPRPGLRVEGTNQEVTPVTATGHESGRRTSDLESEPTAKRAVEALDVIAELNGILQAPSCQSHPAQGPARRHPLHTLTPDTDTAAFAGAAYRPPNQRILPTFSGWSMGHAIATSCISGHPTHALIRGRFSG